MTQKDTKLKTTFFVSWMKMERGNRSLREIADKEAARVCDGRVCKAGIARPLSIGFRKSSTRTMASP